MKRNIISISAVVVLLLSTGINAYFLQRTYTKYSAAGGTIRKAINLPVKQAITSTKQKTVSSAKQGVQDATGLYKFEELSHSKINQSYGTANLSVVTNESLGVNFVMADTPEAKLTASNLAEGWTLQTVDTDPMWAPGACSSKPTNFLQKHYVFIDDGKTLPTDKYNSYVVYDMLTQKFRYFGGNNYTDQQATHEKVLSIADENDQIVFYIDVPDAKGPLAGSLSFKHHRSDAPGYIIRRVIDMNTLHYTDYKLSFAVPSNPAFDYYYIGNGIGQNQLISITADSADVYYAGQVDSNSITLSAVSTTAAPPPAEDTQGSQADNLDQLLTVALPNFITAKTEPGQANFDVTTLGQHDTYQYDTVSSKSGDYATPVIFDAANNHVIPMTTKPTLGFGDYVPLGVF